jgi:hypothetical protein
MKRHVLSARNAPSDDVKNKREEGGDAALVLKGAEKWFSLNIMYLSAQVAELTVSRKVFVIRKAV